jgi:hypothetical protein
VSQENVAIPSPLLELTSSKQPHINNCRMHLYLAFPSIWSNYLKKRMASNETDNFAIVSNSAERQMGTRGTRQRNLLHAISRCLDISQRVPLGWELHAKG